RLVGVVLRARRLHAPLAARLRRAGPRRARGGALAAGQQRDLFAADLEPLALARADEGALRAADAAQLAHGDADVAARQDHAAQGAARHLLVVVVALVVAVVDLRDRGVAPVDDLHAGRAVDQAAAADQDVGHVLLVARPGLRLQPH